MNAAALGVALLRDSVINFTLIPFNLSRFLSVNVKSCKVYAGLCWWAETS